MEQVIFFIDALLLVLVLGIQIQIRYINKKMDEMLQRLS
jgi:hypothetical protein